MKTVQLSSEWIAAFAPKRQVEVADRQVRGLLLRAGPSGVRTFYYWRDVEDPDGKVRRKRVKLARWAIDGGGGAMSLGEAREAMLGVQATRRAEVDGTAEVTVGDLAKAYRRDVLGHQERGDEAWNVVRVHVVEAQPDPKRPPFGEWPARAVRAPDIASLVRHAKERRTVERPDGTTGRHGGPGAARVVLRACRAIFATAVGAGTLEGSPAAALRREALGLPKATSRARVLDADEIKALFEALDLTALLDGTAKPRRLSPSVRLGIAFQLYVPTRTHSIIGARWGEIDLDAARWTVPVERLKLHAEDRAKAKPFTVPLPMTAVAILRRLRKEAGDSPWVLASPIPPEEGEDPKHVEPKALVRALARLQSAPEAGKPRIATAARFTVHDLRRTWRSLAMDLGIDHAVARLSLGHAGLEGVEGVYGRAQLVEQRAKAAEEVAAALDRIRLGKAAVVVPLREHEAV